MPNSPDSRHHQRSRNDEHRRSSHARSHDVDSRQSTSKRKVKEEVVDSKKSTYKAIADTREKMRSALKSVAAVKVEMDDVDQSTKIETLKSSKSINVNASDTAARHREIDRIDSESGFQPQSFQSSSVADERKIRTDEYGLTIDRQNQHEDAIFGRASTSAANSMIANQSAGSDSQKTSIDSTKHVISLAHSNLSADPAIRQERWLKLWRERRSQLLI